MSAPNLPPERQVAEDVRSHEEAIRALKIMDAFNRLALKYPVLEVLDAAKKWVAFIDSQAQKFAEEARTDG